MHYRTYLNCRDLCCSWRCFYATAKGRVLHLGVFEQEKPVLLLEFSRLQRPVLYMNYTAEACAAPGGVYTTAHGPELHMDNRSLCCSRTFYKFIINCQ
jgi:hypothetical protein